MAGRTSRYAAVIFDMDGLLVDSEPFWQRAEIEVFATFGLALSAADCRRTTGLRINEVVEYWGQYHAFGPTPHCEVAAAIVSRVIELIRTEGQLMPGALLSLDFCASRKLPLGLASSSDMRLIDAVLDRFELRSRFQVIHSAQDEPLGKPHPAVYLSTARRMAVPAHACLAIEDSLNGLIAAKASRMGCVAVPAAEDRHDPRFALADAVLPSLLGLDGALWERLGQAHGGARL